MHDPVIGIDLGTTNSAVATVEDGRPRLIPSRAGGRLTPSVLGVTKAGERVVGQQAQALAEEHPDSVVWATKRFLGRRYTPELVQQAKALVPYPLVAGPSGDVRVKLAGRVLPVTQVSAMILGELALDAQAHFGRTVTKCVITVPANFDDNQRQATREAASIAGLDVVRLVNEPTAAALAYGLSRGFEGSALVFDLGGGTFDVSILDVKSGVFEVRATGGDPRLGGEDFDQRIVQWLLAQVDDELRHVVSQDAQSLRRLKVAAEAAKRELTEHEEATVSVSGLGDHSTGGRRTELETVLTRSFFETLSEPLSRRCLEVCQGVMHEAKMNPRSVDVVLLVGGMTRVPLVRRLVADFFGRAPSTDVHPDEAVALGAAVQADELLRQSGQALLLDVASQSLGVGVLGGRVKRLIAKNTGVPVVARDIFFPGTSGQAEARIPVYQGESEFQDENHKLGEVVLKNLHVAARGDVPLEVVFELSGEAILSVKATDLTTGNMETVRLEARAGLPHGEAEKLGAEQANYAKSQGVVDAKRAEELFRKLLERGEKLARMLQKSAQENPSPEADAAVGTVQRLLDGGRSALDSKDAAKCAAIARQLTQLLSGKQEPRA
ncbi:Hsp70 family protein [Myxococcus sp. CA051A]|uniref:Hsp70 family protein n=1 Tax=Myxococcus llanfairpwllgwyngyllgogerychwyrndrobwllllantysiliogogogochensis TaxID=2590453 RepID=A0A540XB67_9BACT|nr:MULTISPECIES: Hsp70 family protein [Myxococcus]NTX02637.1 Hsp70 family protein [Myxococcus sp. CA040A]NTX40845.1 Hsp70 family protein [Myxococcus sp. CA033]NTX50436.1 Hsp70 family protein [Myxococcus sp. CA039A]NTX60333.1 Hsp70 family protein [Myxococcus sp. CA051A]TQF17924.1 Hsp70 family protein [Myxococcus llanfairpwllgwyngyllgogerychwyrndrobwllllantysiliogogogochensis]